MATKDWLPYGSSDPSVLLQEPLTSSAGFLANAQGTPTIHIAGGEFDSVLGYTPKGVGTLKIADVTGYATLDQEGQVSMEVERNWLCRADAATWSNGDAGENSSSFLATEPTAGSTNAQFVTKDSASANDGAIFGMNAGANVYTHTAGKDRFVTVNIGWSGGQVGGKVWWAFDGLINGEATRGLANPSWADVLKTLFIGSNKGLNFFAGNYYCRNLQISNQAPMIPMQKNLSKVAVLSDSMFNSTATTNGTATGDYRDTTTIFTMKRELGKLGIRMGDVYPSINGGYAVSSGPVNSLADKVPDVVAQNPTIVLYRGGTNDVINGGVAIDSTWNTELKADMTALLAASSVKAIVIGTIPTVKYHSTYDTDVVAAKVAAANAYIEALPAWNSNIYVANCYDDVGRENPLEETFIGQANGALDDLHLAGVGHVAHGISYTKALMKAVA